MMYSRVLVTPLRRAFNSVFRQQVRHFDDEIAYQQTSLNLLNKEEESAILVEAFSPLGFRLNNNIRIFGPCAIFPRSILHWNVQGVEDINEDSLSLFCLLEPKLDILILGVGSNTSKIDNSLIRYLRSKKISVEILTTEHACSTFNFLNAEQRFVAAGLIPPDFHEDMGQGIATSANQFNNDMFSFKTGIFETPEDSEDDKKLVQELYGEKNKKLWSQISKKYRGSMEDESEKHDPHKYLKNDIDQNDEEDKKK